MPQIRNSAQRVTHSLTRVKSRDASASKKRIQKTQSSGRVDPVELFLELQQLLCLPLSKPVPHWAALTILHPE